MSLFQLAGIIVTGLSALLAIRRVLRRRSAWRTQGVWVVIWLSAMAAFIWPDGTARLAQAVGIGRGADLILYLAILSGFWAFARLSARQRQTERDLTRLVRELAISHARVGDATPTPTAAAPSAHSSPTRHTPPSDDSAG